jgi:hypothetical protein
LPPCSYEPISPGNRKHRTSLPVKPTPLTAKLENDIKRLNEFFEGFELEGGIHRGYIRVFNNGDHPRFNWNMGGRLYSHTERSYQQMDRSDRLRMKVSGAFLCWQSSVNTKLELDGPN